MKEIRSVCLKCGKEGIQRISVKNPKYPHLRYLSFQHGENKRCYIGRVRTSDEALGELNEPQNIEEYRSVIKEIVKYGRSLTERNGRVGLASQIVQRELKIILDKYGLWS